ncbi:hypothetical protein CVT25_007868 [Psilocybe cyanescens]|uniref:Uncharacterized protein n=1 Tax=Psilocybe cyanescens TaxID=93625 RepID=A0A409XJH8_PSICY|nr:hypothetical protein CVT25_007868 [Psilocybe cyanescens]
MTDIDQAISLQQKYLPNQLKAISLQQTCIQLTPECHANLPTRLSNLGLSLGTCFDTQEILLTYQRQSACNKNAFSLLQKAMQTCLLGCAILEFCFKNTLSTLRMQ